MEALSTLSVMTRAALALLVVVLTGCSGSAGGSEGREIDDPLLAANANAAATAPADPLRLLVAGDSIADGYYASTPERGFAEVLDDRLAEDGAVVPVTVAVSGARAFRVAASVERETVVAEPFDLAVLEAGTNDIGVSTTRDMADGYRRLLDAVESRSPDAEVVCLGPWDKPRVVRSFESVVRRLCADHVYVPLSDLFVDRSLHGPTGEPTELGRRDWYHPNDRGHAAIAQRIQDALRG